MERLTLAAYAKINLSLDVVGKRPDGYHLLEMVMQSVSLHDTVQLQKNTTGDIRLTCTDPAIPGDEKNIAHRCAALFLQQCNISSGVDIHIEKRIPSGAGLAGGSADGAAVLVGLNQLFHAGLSENELIRLGVQIGADIPFCICGGTKLCKGIGEVITPLPALPDCTILLCKPSISIDTAEAFRQIDNGTITHRPDTNALCGAISKGDLSAVGSLLENAFETALPMTVLQKIKTVFLSFGALGAGMTGSGSAMLGIFDDPAKAEACAASLKTEYPDVFCTVPTQQGVETIKMLSSV